MTINKKNYLDKLPAIALIPNHGSINQIPSYPLCAKREIFCGPNLINEDSENRKYIHTNSRFFDIDNIISQLNEKDRNIDLIYAPLEVNVACFPKNLHKIKCPKIALIFDTHHLEYSISSLINYMKREKFTHAFMYAQPAHLHFFYEAGLVNSAYFPKSAQKFEPIDNKKSGITYIGHSWSSSHPRRSRMVQFLKKNLPKVNVPFYHYNRLPRELWHKVLARSKIVVVSSLNGQFTPQIYSCLFAGALCFVDELSPQTFLNNLFENGKHLITWQNFNDLLNKLIYYYNHPEEADMIAKAGKIQAEKNFAISKSFGMLISDFVFKNKIDSRFLAINDKRCQIERDESIEYLNLRLRLYENIQELHRIHESLKLISLTEKNLKSSMDLADLPRLKITHAFRSNSLKNGADSFFQNTGVNDQIQTILISQIKDMNSYEIGLIESPPENTSKFKFLVNSIANLLKSNSLLWVIGTLSPLQKELLKKNGFKPYRIRENSKTMIINKLSRKLCFMFWKRRMYPFPYLTLKPAMETVTNLNVFLRGWQAYFPFLF